MKLMTIYFIMASMVIGCTSTSNTNATKPIPTTPITNDNAVHAITNQYLVLKDAFITDSAALVDAALAQLIQACNINGDSLAKAFATQKDDISKAASSINALAGSMLTVPSLKDKKVLFKDLTQPVTTLLKIYNPTTVYIQHCPMAEQYSKDANVYWVSRAADIQNPFYPITMLECGNITDTLQVVK